MKTYTILKVGYSSGIYGCSGEYFKCIYTSKKWGFDGFQFQGMYGAEERVAKAMQKKGYKHAYQSCGYGKITGRDRKFFMSEYEVIDRDGNLKIELSK